MSERATLLNSLQERLGYRFRQSELLERALSHSSWTHEQGGAHNERLEFLGDSIVGAVVVSNLFHAFPGADEGVLSRQKHKLVGTATLADIGRDLGLALMLQVGAGARKKGVHQNPAVLEDTTEALLGAIYLDSDFATAAAVAARWFEPYIDRLELERPKGADAYKEAISLLHEAVIKPPVRCPAYFVILERTGSDHEPAYRIGWWVGGLMLADAWGASKKAAKQAAAALALDALADRVSEGWRPDRDATPPTVGESVSL